MDIAKAKRRENIAEYILYLWQIEDLLRALQFSPEAIYSQLIAPRGIEEGQRHNYLLWYMDIANLLHQEGKDEKGHLEHTLHLIGDLHDLHLQLMQTGDRIRRSYRPVHSQPRLPSHMPEFWHLGQCPICSGDNDHKEDMLHQAQQWQ